MYDDNLPRSHWRMARIRELVSQRSALVEMIPGNFITKRAIQHLFPLEIEPDEPIDTINEPQPVSGNELSCEIEPVHQPQSEVSEQQPMSMEHRYPKRIPKPKKDKEFIYESEGESEDPREISPPPNSSSIRKRRGNTRTTMTLIPLIMVVLLWIDPIRSNPNNSELTYPKEKVRSHEHQTGNYLLLNQTYDKIKPKRMSGGAGIKWRRRYRIKTLTPKANKTGPSDSLAFIVLNKVLDAYEWLLHKPSRPNFNVTSFIVNATDEEQVQTFNTTATSKLQNPIHTAVTSAKNRLPVDHGHKARPLLQSSSLPSKSKPEESSASNSTLTIPKQSTPVTKREVSSTIPFPTWGDSDDEIKRAIDQFRNQINKPNVKTGQPELPLHEASQNRLDSFEQFHRELKRARPQFLPGQTYKGLNKLHPKTLTTADGSSSISDRDYYFCRTKSPTLWHVPDQDPMCQEIHNLLRPWKNGTFTIFSKILEPKPVIGAHFCAKKYEKVNYYTNLLGDAFQDPSHTVYPVSREECADFFKYKTCSEGTMTRKSKYMYSTNKAIEIKFPGRFEGFFKGLQTAEALNCLLEETQISYHPNTLQLQSPIYDLSHCNYTTGMCIVSNMTLIWYVDCPFGKCLRCQYSKQGV